MADQALHLAELPNQFLQLSIDQANSRANVLNHELWQELHDMLLSLANRTETQGLILSSTKPGIFIAGADLKYLGNVPAPNDLGVKAWMEFGLATLALLETLPFPTIACIDGATLGGGLEVALACDYRIVGTHPKISIGLPEVNLGLIPGWGGTQRLPRVIGLAKACAMIEQGQTWSASEAVEARVVDAQVPSEQLQDYAIQTLNQPGWQGLRQTKQQPISSFQRETFQAAIPAQPAAVREAMQVIMRGSEMPLADALQLETEAFVRLAGSEESRGMIADFFASRKK